MKIPRIDEWIKQMWYIHKRMLFDQNKGLNQPHVTTPREREMTMPNETSQAQIDNYYMASFISLNLIKVEIRMEGLGRKGDQGTGKGKPVGTEVERRKGLTIE